jgi:4-amino-4-deoxy-L-arabinose transferase-like glycosyltransferase
LVTTVRENPPAAAWSRFGIFLPLLLTATVYLPSTLTPAVIDYDEGNYSQVALQMISRGDWVTPYNNGVRFLEKPPLMYWITALSFRAFGVNEFALRLPSALAVIALVGVVTLFARRAAGERAAVMAGLCAAFCVGTFLFTREALHDVWLVLFVTLALYAFLEWHQSPLPSLGPALLFYASLAGAVMTKSLVGVAFPVGIVALFYAVSRSRPAWRRLHLLPGSLLFLLLAAPWHYLAAVRNPGFLRSFFLNEQLLRFLGRHDPPVLWSMPLLTFWALIPIWFFPWAAFLPAVMATIRRPEDDRQRTLSTLALAWVVVILGFFSVSDRLEHYAFPVLPALALLVGSALSGTGGELATRWGFRGLAILGALLLVAAVAAGVWLAVGGYGLASATARTHVIAETDFSILADMPPRVLSGLVLPAAVTVVALAVGFLVALWFEARSRRFSAVLTLTVVMILVCGLAQWSLTICEDLISSRQFGLEVARAAHPGDHVVVVGDYESANSLRFYEPLPLEVYDGVAYALIPGMRYPDAPRIVLTEEEFQALWGGEGRVFALVPKARQGDLKLGGVEMREVLDRVLVRNR